MIEEFKINKRPEEWMSIHSQMQDSAWDDFTLDRQGELTEWLAQYQSDEYLNNWNKLATKYRPILKVYVASLSKEQGLNEDLASYLEWDFLHLYIEQYFCKFEGAPIFYLNYALPHYLNNRIPCAWVGNFPQGRIIMWMNHFACR